MYDSIETLRSSMIQHGPYNNRIYLMKLNANDLPEIIDDLEDLASQRGYSKIFAKVPFRFYHVFHNHGFRREGNIPGFYSGVEAAEFLGQYLDETRGVETRAEVIRQILDLAKSKRPESRSSHDSDGEPPVERASESDIPPLAEIYRAVFKTYPFPIHDESYLRKTLHSHVDYYCVRQNGRMIAAASAEIDRSAGNVEMTDFATLPRFRGQGLALRILRRMEIDRRREGQKTAYTIARALSPGMNVTFAKAGYRYGGTLTNNTNISGTIESMNIWFKSL